MQIIPFCTDHLSEAAALFVSNFKQLRQSLPILPDTLENPEPVVEKVSMLIDNGPAFAALEGGKLVGYIGGFLLDQFRGTDRKVAYCPEWGHGAAGSGKSAITNALYRAVAAEWTAAGCHAHAMSLLAHDSAGEKIWFWNGFGLAVVDAIRPLTPIDGPAAEGYAVRKAALEDVETLATLEAEHWQHYALPPVLMAPKAYSGAGAFADLLSNPHNSVWLALSDGEPMGYARFEGASFGAADVVNGETTVANTGMYVRPAYRGRRVAVALLNAALRDYAARGMGRCSVDFESFNPEAAVFWMKHFAPACLSVMRVPECVRLPA